MQTLINCLLVAAGALVMGDSLRRTRKFFTSAEYLQPEAEREIRRMIRLHRGLTWFFLFGYLVVLAALVLRWDFVGEFFTSLIFLFGAGFVWIGVSIQKRMVGALESTLHGLLPICANCKKIRFAGADPETQNSWAPVEQYLVKTTHVQFSHGICPECIRQLYPEMAGEEIDGGGKETARAPGTGCGPS